MLNNALMLFWFILFFLKSTAEIVEPVNQMCANFAYCCKTDPLNRNDCWKANGLSPNDCCANIDCWTGDLSFSECCEEKRFGAAGNPLCWSDGKLSAVFCCKSVGYSSWYESLFRFVNLDDMIYTVSEFYTDSQYGDDFGYYSSGRVLHSGGQSSDGPSNSTESFAHYTTLPMALSPHFASILCRKIFLMWIAQEMPSTFQIFEFGAGSGQLAVDIRDNCLDGSKASAFNRIMNKWNPLLTAKWRSATRYMTVERSPALARRQRSRGLKVVEGDAQSVNPTCGNARERAGTFQAGMVLSNELIDAFAPVKLRLTFGDDNVTSCQTWQETRVIQIISSTAFAEAYAVSDLSSDEINDIHKDLQDRTQKFFSDLSRSMIWKSSTEALTGSGVIFKKTETEYFALFLAITGLVDYASDLRMPLLSTSFIIKLREDEVFRARFTAIYNKEMNILGELVAQEGALIFVPKSFYRQIRHLIRTNEAAEIKFINSVVSRRVNTPITKERCGNFQPWMRRHEELIRSVQAHYRALGYLGVQFSVRLGEEQFIRLADCILKGKGFILSVDYGSNFEALSSSMSTTPLEDGVSVPPIPLNLVKKGLRSDCQSNWLSCPGWIDLTSFIDFTNIARAGSELGWEPLLYGPQSFLERIMALSEKEREHGRIPPPYRLRDQIGPRNQRRHMVAWYGNEGLPGVQRWTSFKVLIQSRGVVENSIAKELTISWPLSMSEVDPCWIRDATAFPQTDYLIRNTSGYSQLVSGNLRYDVLLEDYNRMYEEAHLYTQMTEWIFGKWGGERFCKGNYEHLNDALSESLLADIWGVAKVVGALKNLLEIFGSDSISQNEPGVCLARRMFIDMCSV